MRPRDEDIQACVECVLCRETGVSYYKNALAVLYMLANMPLSYIGAYFSSHEDQQVVTSFKINWTTWWDSTVAENCAIALELYKQHYPEG